jgi:ribonuclease D
LPRGGGAPFRSRSRAAPAALGGPGDGRAPGDSVAPEDERLITDPAALDELLAALADHPFYALDTEFHRERTYYPKLALVQLAWENADGATEVALIDPLKVDIRPLGGLLAGPATVVIHAAAQDLEVLEVATGSVPSQMFDTQIAAGFLGLGLPSLSELHERELGTSIPKGDRLTDWLRRPLTPAQLAYAAADVANLPLLYHRLSHQLDERSRLAWAAAECELMRRRVRMLRDPEQAWTRIREARQLRGRAVAVAKEVAAWRERRAAAVDQPTRHVLPDLAVAAISQRAPATEAELRKIRGLEERFLRGGAAESLLEAIQRGVSAPIPTLATAARTEVPKELRGALNLLTGWVAQRARDLGIDASLLATRSDLEDLLRGVEGARLATGWRADLIGAQIADLIAGRAALAFDGRGGLVLEERSHRTLDA